MSPLENSTTCITINEDADTEVDKEAMIVQEAKENPNKIGNITKPAPIKCLPTCQMQETVNEMSFAPYPQKRNFFYQREFCGVASHLRQAEIYSTRDHCFRP